MTAVAETGSTIAREIGESQTSDDGGIMEPTQPQPALDSDAVPHRPPWMEDDVWGVLEPIPSRPDRECLIFRFDRFRYRIGRDSALNDYALEDNFISARHFTVLRNDVYADTVTVGDCSRNGTFIQNRLIGKGKYAVLKDGNEVAVGQLGDEPGGPGDLAWRYVYHVGIKAKSKDLEDLRRVYDLQMNRELGSGAFGKVYEALHKTEGVSYAVKIVKGTILRRQGNSRTCGAHGKSRTSETEGGSISETLGEIRTSGTQGESRESGKQDENRTPVARESFNILREIAIMKGLQHRHICEMKEYFIFTDSIALVLELLQGGNLSNYQKRHPSMREAEVRYFTYQICDALSYLHDRGIVHRDLKPQNVLLTRDDPPVAKVADFGLAKMIDNETLLKTYCGTPAYIAPEISDKSPSGYSSTVDSWSLGVMVFEMFVPAGPIKRKLETFNFGFKETSLGPRIRWNALKLKMSRRGCIFVAALLDLDPSRRMKMARACEHPWLARQAANPTIIHEADDEDGVDDGVEKLPEEEFSDEDGGDSYNAATDEASDETTERSASRQDGGHSDRSWGGTTYSYASTERCESRFALTELSLGSLESVEPATTGTARSDTQPFKKKRKTWHSSYCVSLGSSGGLETTPSAIGSTDTGCFTLPSTAIGATIAPASSSQSTDALKRLYTRKRRLSQRSACTDTDTDPDAAEADTGTDTA
ncbi:kinase-like protein [Pilatotrama ljubarskyi]|nr:kinase-like protein [Pilatotrama ljubarskyi]